MKNTFRLLLLISFISCFRNKNNELVEIETINNTKNSIKKSSNSPDADSLDDRILQEDPKKDIQNIFEEFPSIISSDIELVITGTFEKQDIPKVLQNNIPELTGLFKRNDSTYYLKKTTPLVSKTTKKELINIEDVEYYDIKTNNEDKCILLLRGSFNTLDSVVNNIKKSKFQILPGESYNFEFNNYQYKLLATGEVDDEYRVSKYQLFIENPQVKHSMTLLTSVLFFDDSMIEILFIGDIDMDGKPDLILDNSSKYSIYTPTIYLSSYASSDELVKPVAYINSYSGC